MQLAFCTAQRPQAAAITPSSRRSVTGSRVAAVIARRTAAVVRASSGDEQPKTEEPAKQPKYIYADEQPEPPRKDTMSPEMKERLRREYYSLGGAPNVKATNWALYIILGISALAVASALTGAL